MTLDEVMEKATIKFPHEVGIEKMIELLDFLCKFMPASINYQVQYNMSKNGRDQREQGIVSIAGHINHLEKLGYFDGFETLQENYKLISGMRFSLVPDYDLDDYRPEQIKLWDEVRKKVGYYFNRICKKK